MEVRVTLAVLPPFGRVRHTDFLFSHSAVLLILLILTSSHFWSQHHLVDRNWSSIWTSINFGHPHYKTGNLLVWKQNGLVSVTTQGDLVRAPAHPFHSVLPFQDVLTALVFLQRGFLTLRQVAPCYNLLTFPAYVFTGYLSPSTRRLLGKDEKPTLIFLQYLSKNLTIQI